MKVTKAQAEANRAHVVETASQLFRERGFDGVGVADLMAAAGFTHGGFYKHFGSKADLMAESTACGIAQTTATVRRRGCVGVRPPLPLSRAPGRSRHRLHDGCARRGRCTATGVGPGRVCGRRRASGGGTEPAERRVGRRWRRAGASQDPRRVDARGGRSRHVAGLPGRFTSGR